MKCPKCEGKARNIDTVQTKDGETYRRRKCLDCGRIFYTCEYVVTLDAEFMEKWRASHRMNPRRDTLAVRYAKWQTSTNPDDREGLSTAKCSSCGYVVPVTRKALPHICPGCEAVMD